MSLFLNQIADLQQRVAALEQKILDLLATPPAAQQPPAQDFSTPAKVLRIVDAVAAAYGLNRKTLLGHSHRRELVRARHLAMYLAYATTAATLREIGEIFGHDPSGVSNGVQCARARIETDPAAAAEAKPLIQRFTPPAEQQLCPTQ